MSSTGEAPRGAADGSRGQRGAGTLLTAGVCLALLATASMASVLVLWVGQVGAAQDAADLAALAAAGAHAGGGKSCDAARSSAVHNHATLVGCRVEGDTDSFVVEVTIRRALEPTLPGAPTSVERVALAGSLQ
ncbi:Rv3654c family TadE-like protein [Tessaracoccus antarcticus]|nr:Rv3654c family TadE-like protein [Tessaracoccus antarcticus]